MAKAKVQAVSADSAKILVVDDDERNLLALSEVLSPLGDVVTVTSGRDALRRLLKDDFAVILLDVFMPGLDGYETAALVREREQTARIPIIFLSAVNRETEHLMRGYEMGAVDYVFKPVDPMILKSKISVFVDLYNMRRHIETQAEAEAELRETAYREQLERLKVEAELAESEQRQAAVLKALPMVLYVEEPDKALRVPQYVAGNFEALTGFKPEATKSEPDFFEKRVHPDDRDAVARALEQRLKTGTMAVEYRWKCADGEYRHFFDQTVELPSAKGQGRRLAGTFMDVSDRKSLETQLLQAQKMDALGKLTGGVAHDFNNLLAAVLGGIHVLQRRLELGEREQTVLDQMRHASEQGAELVRRMMAFARQQELTPVAVDPSALCDSVAGLVNHTLGGTVTVEWQCPERRLNLLVDRSQLELALMNLILNARDAMDGAGRITVAIKSDSRLLDGHPALAISVSDQGSGIPADIIDKVTEPFFTTKDTGKGTGLGLSMVAGFVHQSGGELNIDSKPGKGTTVTLLLPATAARVESGANDHETDLQWLTGRRLMLIDDDDAVRLVLTEQFRDGGGIVEQYHSGKAAIEALRKAPQDYDLVLSDFAMPDLDGLETLREVEKVAPHTQVALMTGYAEDLRAANNEKFPVVRKPINLKSLAEIFAR